MLCPVYPPDHVWTQKPCRRCGNVKMMPKAAKVCGYCLYKGSLPKPRPRVPALRNLGELRRRKGISRSELAGRAGTDHSVIYRQESGMRRFAERDLATRIARALEVSVVDLHS